MVEGSRILPLRFSRASDTVTKHASRRFPLSLGDFCGLRSILTLGPSMTIPFYPLLIPRFSRPSSPKLRIRNSGCFSRIAPLQSLYQSSFHVCTFLVGSRPDCPHFSFSTSKPLIQGRLWSEEISAFFSALMISRWGLPGSEFLRGRWIFWFLRPFSYPGRYI